LYVSDIHGTTASHSFFTFEGFHAGAIAAELQPVYETEVLAFAIVKR
jgi:hypothetical protein